MTVCLIFGGNFRLHELILIILLLVQFFKECTTHQVQNNFVLDGSKVKEKAHFFLLRERLLLKIYHLIKN